MSDVIQRVIKNRDGTISIGSTQDVSSILAQNVHEANNNTNRKNNAFGRKIASIPMNMINAWCKEWNCTMQQLLSETEFKAKMMASLRDPDYLKLRTDHGRI